MNSHFGDRSESSYYFANWAVTDWWIDGVAGDDSNGGTTALTPLRTGAELARRLGPYAMWGQSVTVHVMANGMTDALVLKGTMLVAGTHLDIVGTPTVSIDAGTVSVWTARNHATPEADLLSATGVADWTAYQWQRVRVTGGPNVGSICWVSRANPSALGVGVARVSRPMATNLTSTTTLVSSTAAIAVGNPVVVETVPYVPAVVIEVNGPLLSAATPAWDRRQLAITDLDVRTLKVTGTSADVSSYFAVQKCRLSNVAVYVGNSNSATIGTAAGCLFYNREQSTTYKPPDACIFNSLFGDMGNATLLQPHANCLMSSVLLQGLRFNVPTTVIAQLVDVQVFDVTAVDYALQLSNGRLNNASGNNNAGYGLQIPNRAMVTCSGTQNLQGAISNGRLGTAPQVNLTLPQLLQPDDYAQRGTIQLPGGAANWVDVVVPWWDPTTQRLTIGIKDLNAVGTIQVWAPTANRTNTGFRLQCGNVTNTSTVDWMISPLGRNIFISTS